MVRKSHQGQVFLDILVLSTVIFGLLFAMQKVLGQPKTYGYAEIKSPRIEKPANSNAHPLNPRIRTTIFDWKAM